MYACKNVFNQPLAWLFLNLSQSKYSRLMLMVETNNPNFKPLTQIPLQTLPQSSIPHHRPSRGTAIH